tara:strand:- start:657 stop:1337 length:681 start_codon:yes stop_codon:yes gene_type:complete
LINWIKGDLIDFWQLNNKFFILINCQNIGYEIQILESLFIKLKTNKISHQNVILWTKLIKNEDSDLLFGFTSKDEKNFYIEIINIRGIGSQIGMGILNKFSVSEFISAINTKDKKLICSVPGIGQKMAERLILELKNKFKNEPEINEEEKYNENFQIKNSEINKLLSDLRLTLQSLNYSKKEINVVLPFIIKQKDILNKEGKIITYENLLKLAMNYLDHGISNLVC